MSSRATYLLCTLTAALVFGTHTANARTLTVGTCTGAQPNFSTIQSAVDSAFSGDKVVICPGTYAEQVSITRNLTLSNVRGMASPTVTVPAGGVQQNSSSLTGFPVAAQILADAGSPLTVTIKGLTIDGAGSNLNGCGVNLAGIYYKNAGGTISGNSVKNQILTEGLQGCQVGLGIYVQGATSAAVISNNTVTNFQKGGIVMDRSIAQGEIAKNTVVGIGPTDAIAQNGIQLSRGSSAVITANNVSNVIYSPETAGSSAILLYDLDAGAYTSPPSVTRNIINNAQYGVALDAANGTVANPLQVTANKTSNTPFAGIGLYSDVNTAGNPQSDDYINVANNTIQNTSELDGVDACSDNNTITGNKVTNSAESGVHLDSLCTQPDSSPSGSGNTVSGNRITIACVGILSGPPEGANTIGTNRFSDVGTPVEYGSDSATCGPRHMQRHGSPRPHAGGGLPAALKPVK